MTTEQDALDEPTLDRLEDHAKRVMNTIEQLVAEAKKETHPTVRATAIGNIAAAAFTISLAALSEQMDARDAAQGLAGHINIAIENFIKLEGETIQ